MDRVLKWAAALATCAFAATSASAQTPSIVGVWSMTVHDQYGNAISVVWDQFTADGHVTSRQITPAGTIQYTGVYQLLNGGAVARARFDDYEPKQMCTLVCTPVTPSMTMGQVDDTAVTFRGPDVLCLGADCYNRQQ